MVCRTKMSDSSSCASAIASLSVYVTWPGVTWATGPSRSDSRQDACNTLIHTACYNLRLVEFSLNILVLFIGELFSIFGKRQPCPDLIDPRKCAPQAFLNSLHHISPFSSGRNTSHHSSAGLRPACSYTGGEWRMQPVNR